MAAEAAVGRICVLLEVSMGSCVLSFVSLQRDQLAKSSSGCLTQGVPLAECLWRACAGHHLCAATLGRHQGAHPGAHSAGSVPGQAAAPRAGPGLLQGPGPSSACAPGGHRLDCRCDRLQSRPGRCRLPACRHGRHQRCRCRATHACCAQSVSLHRLGPALHMCAATMSSNAANWGRVQLAL